MIPTRSTKKQGIRLLGFTKLADSHKTLRLSYIYQYSPKGSPI